MIKIKEIISQISNLIIEKNTLSLEKSCIDFQTDSRAVVKNSAFVCIPGFVSDGHKYANKAIEQGASLLIVEHFLPLEISQIKVSSARRAAALLAKMFYENPTSKFKLIGITGTNGKTTTSHFIHQMLLSDNRKVGLIGTLGYYINDKKFNLERTTPDIIELNKIFAKMVDNNIEIVIMEVSSHAIALDRVFGLDFDIVNFTNLSQDHLDFHPTLDDYFNTKLRLFTEFNYQSAIINSDDKYGMKVIDCVQKSSTFGYSESDFQITKSFFHSDRIEFSINDFDINFTLSLPGKFNLYNALMAMINLKNLGYSFEQIKRMLSQVKNIPGRLTKIENRLKLNIFVDYAHTPDAIANVLSTFDDIKKDRIIVVFGAGGNRDSSKRPKMLAKAIRRSDLTIVTTDNPRSENPVDIIRDIIANAQTEDNIFVERDRKKAIEIAMSVANHDDIIVIAGKGDENYQEINGKKIDFSDAEVIRNFAPKTFSEVEPSRFTIPLPFEIDVLNLELWFGQSIDNLQVTHFDKISTNTKTIRKKGLFFALQGEKFDAHQYVKNIIDENIAIVANDLSTKNQILVENTADAYRLVANKYRHLLNTKIVAITGSTGKTSLKVILTNILKQKYKTISTYKNENNNIGVPKTIFRFRPVDDFAVIEIGTNHFGEIKISADCLSPDFAIINNIGASHLEFLKSLAGVYQEKSQLFRRELKLRLFGTQDFFAEFQNKGKSVGYEKSDYQIKSVSKIAKGYRFKINNTTFSIDSDVRHNVINSAFAIAFAKEIKMEDDNIQTGLTNLKIDGRMDIISSKSNTILFDCYNANPVSMKSAIEFWKSYQPEKKHIAILGDMLELGNDSKKYHIEIGSLLTDEHLEVIAVGDLSKKYGPQKFFATVEELIEADLKFENSIILIKASHGVHLEKLKEII